MSIDPKWTVGELVELNLTLQAKLGAAEAKLREVCPHNNTVEWIEDTYAVCPDCGTVRVSIT